jgi:transmembrane sensor
LEPSRVESGMISDDPMWPVIDRVLTGEASADDRAQVDAWVAADPRREALLRGLRVAVTHAPAVNTDAAWERLSARLDNSSVLPFRTAAPRVPGRGWIALAAAASVLLAVAVWRVTGDGIESIVAPAGQRVTATLPDGSTIQLSAGSRASWRRDFSTKRRDVSLEGEGYFDVVHDDARPFRVWARNAVATDIGTRFVVRAWPELPSVEVAVDEGIVALAESASAAPGTRLAAGSRGRLQRDGQVIVTSDAATALGWTRGELVFDDTPLEEALPAIGRWYGVTIDPAPRLRDRRLTARLTQQPLPSVLEALEVVLGARVTRDGNRIVLAPIQ